MFEIYLILNFMNFDDPCPAIYFSCRLARKSFNFASTGGLSADQLKERAGMGHPEEQTGTEIQRSRDGAVEEGQGRVIHRSGQGRGNKGAGRDGTSRRAGGEHPEGRRGMDTRGRAETGHPEEQEKTEYPEERAGTGRTEQRAAAGHPEEEQEWDMQRRSRS